MIAGLILAAGEGRRFGGPKQLAELEGRPLIEHAVETMRAVSALERIVVVLGAHAEAVRGGADLAGTDTVVAANWADGISASLRAGVAAVSDADAALITLGDQPLITPRVVSGVLGLAACGAPAARATYGGRPGHPVLIRRELFGEVEQLRGDSGARGLLERAGVREIECGRMASADDVDTPADLGAIEARITTEVEVRG